MMWPAGHVIVATRRLLTARIAVAATANGKNPGRTEPSYRVPAAACGGHQLASLNSSVQTLASSASVRQSGQTVMK
jgi:hypothetical protein